MPRVLRIGHRGAAGHAPENTLAAVRQGIELGVDFVEIDVRRTADGVLVALHDATVNRTTYRLEKSGSSMPETGSVSRRLKRCSRWLEDAQD
jgi:glycerophosphoryl diester phosphodiesterase